MSVVVWLPNRDAGWELPPAEPYDHPWIGGGRRTMHELAVAVACTGRAVEFRGEMSIPVLDELAEAAGARPELPAAPRPLTAGDTVIVNEGLEDPRVVARLALSPARTVLMALAPLGLFGWSFTAEPWSPPDFETVPIDSVARPEHFAGAAALGFEIWTHSPGLDRAAAAGGVTSRCVGNGQPVPFPEPPRAKDVDVVAVGSNRWAPLARPVIEELERRGVACARLPESSHADLIAALGRARVFVHPSRIEGDSRLGREARAMGAVPVVLDTNPFAVGFDEAGGSVAVGSVDEMADAVTALLADPGRLARLAATGMDTARRQVEWAPYVERVDAALREPVPDPGRGARAGIGAAVRIPLDDRIETLERELAHARWDRDRHQRWLEGVNASASWRITAPLRALKRRLGRS
jgi:hypothetical protein